MTGWLIRQLRRRISAVKGGEFTIDDRIPAGYLLRVIAVRTLMLVRGVWRFPFRHDRPFIGSGVRLRSRHRLTFGAGVTLGPGAYIDACARDGVRLGDRTSVGRNTRIECTGSLQTLGVGLTVGTAVGLGTDNFYGCAGGISIGDDTIIGNFVSFHAENHVIGDLHRPIRLQGVTHDGIVVGRSCWIGAKVTVLDGARVGDGCVVAAGSVVTAGTYESHGIYAGIPAKLLKSRV